MKELVQIMFVLLLSCFLVFGCSSDDDDDESETMSGRTFGGPGNDYGYELQQTSDGGYVIVGSTESSGPGLENVYLIRLDGQLGEKWSRSIGSAGNSYSWGQSVQQTGDGGFLISGGTNTFGWVSYLLKTDSNGQRLWEKGFDGPATSANGICETDTGDYLVVSENCLLRIDQTGSIIWQVEWMFQAGYDLVQTDDHHCVIAGLSARMAGEIYLEKRNINNGALIWGPIMSGLEAKDRCSLTRAHDGGLVLAATNGNTLHLLKTDQNGTMIWQHTLNGPYESCAEIRATPDGGYIVTGSSSNDAFLLKTDTNGNQVWVKKYGGQGEDRGFSVLPTSSGGYILVGSTESTGAGACDVLLLTLDQDGNQN
ncbi:hypothetical protein JXQ70_00700 [bacterium]|nr:hypothetical protein [bacterium]